MSRNDCSRRGVGKRSQNGFEDWGGYMGAKRHKLSEQFDKNLAEEDILGPKSDIFKGVAIYVDGYTKPSSDELKRIMRQHGGRYEQYMFKRQVTHVIATNLPDVKIKKHFKNCKVVKPEWIIDSVTAGRLLSYAPYLLYTSQNKKQHGMASYSTFSVTRQTSTSSTLARIASMEENSMNTVESLGNSVSELETSSVNGNNKDLVPENMDIDTDTDSDDNEFCRLLADSRKSDMPTPVGLNNHNNTDKESSLQDTLLEESKDCLMLRNSSLYDGDKMNDTGNSSLISGNKVTKDLSAVGMTLSPCYDSNRVQSSKKSSSSKGMAIAGEPEFISEFYNNSRLHHLSTWKSEFKSYVNELQKKGPNFLGRERLRDFVQKKFKSLNGVDTMGRKSVGKPDKIVMHVDMDCFFVSVGLRKRPELRGKPVAVTHSRGQGVKSQQPGSDPHYEFEQWKQRKLQKGVQSGNQLPDDVGDSWNVVSKTSESFHSMAEIASCSYEARQAGLKNGMFMGKAKTLCPDLVTIPYDFEGYNEVSRLLYDIVASYTHDIEAVSCDEMLVDCTDLLADTGAEPLDFASILRREIFLKTNCTASAGLGSNILQAKMATRKAKPNGQYHLKPDEVIDFMKVQSVKDIPGVGWSMSRRLQSLSVSTCGDLQNLDLATLQKEFGPKTGQSLYKYCRGQDDRLIKLEQERKSVSAEINYGIRFKNDYDAEKFLLELSEEVHNRLKKISMKGKTVTLKLMVRREDAPLETAKFMGHGLCNNISKSSTLPLATDDPKIIAKECLTILKQQRLNVQDLRGVGIQLQRLEPAQVGLKASKGTASILKFAVAKQQDSMKSTTDKDSSMTMIRTEKVSDTNQAETKDKRETVSLEKDRCEIMSSGMDGGEVRCLKKSWPPVQSSSECDGHNVVSSVEIKTSNKTVTENKSCSDSTQSIAEDLSRRKNSLIVPPLPSLNLNFSPIVSVVQQVPVFGTGAQSTPTTSRKEPASDYFPSPSQIDEEVLQELPPDIRKQIESEMKLRKKSATVKTHSSTVITTSQEPGCSYWTNTQPPETTQSISHHTDSPITALPSLSQLDESCFNALPEDIQNELKSAYSHQNSGSSKGHKSPTSKKEPQKLKSPNRNQSPGRGKKNSPVFKVPRGRPARGRPKKLEFISQKQPRISSAIQGRKPDEGTQEEICVTNDVIVIDIQPPSAEEQGPSSSVKQDVQSDQSEQSVSLCGAVTITEVRALLKEWLHSSPDPEQDDEDIMTTYLISLVQGHDLEKVDLVIKFLNRHIKRLGNSAWMKTFDKILDSVQTVIKALYGSSLKVL